MSSVVSGARDRYYIWDADTKQIIRCLSAHTNWVNCIWFSPDKKRLASTSDNGTLKIWDVELVFNINNHWGNVWTAAYSSNGTKIASGSADCMVHVWKTIGKQQSQPLIHDSPVYSIAWYPDSCCLISACYDGHIYFWNAPTSAQLGSSLHAHSAAIHSLAISSDGELMATASNDHTARLWSTSTRKPFGRVLQHADMVFTVAFSPDSRIVATSGQENTIFLWDISQEFTITMNVVSPSFVSPASNFTSYIDQPPSASSNSLSGLLHQHRTDGTEFAQNL
ncbi:WD40 repeat-like protein [Suillus decipiens]|nr:WD40 repeat-like protein [Suillus decipiens]